MIFVKSSNLIMNLGLKTVFNNVFSPAVSIRCVPVRYRYYAEKIARGPYSKKFGYEDKIFKDGPLPRLKDASPLPMPVYCPANAWSRKKVVEGQNDYIDLLGGLKIKPYEVSYDVPKWLRGKRGNEMQLLLLKQKVYKNTLYELENPTAWFNISRRVKYLYRYLNKKTKTGFSPKQ